MKRILCWFGIHSWEFTYVRDGTDRYGGRNVGVERCRYCLKDKPVT